MCCICVRQPRGRRWPGPPRTRQRFRACSASLGRGSQGGVDAHNYSFRVIICDILGIPILMCRYLLLIYHQVLSHVSIVYYDYSIFLFIICNIHHYTELCVLVYYYILSDIISTCIIYDACYYYIFSCLEM